MAKGGVIACLLPATSFNLGAVFAPARDMVNAGVPVAMATDFNPGSCPCLNMQFVINLPAHARGGADRRNAQRRGGHRHG